MALKTVDMEVNKEEMCRNFISGYTLKSIESRVSKRYLYTRIYSSIIHDG